MKLHRINRTQSNSIRWIDPIRLDFFLIYPCRFRKWISGKGFQKHSLAVFWIPRVKFWIPMINFPEFWNPYVGPQLGLTKIIPFLTARDMLLVCLVYPNLKKGSYKQKVYRSNANIVESMRTYGNFTVAH